MSGRPLRILYATAEAHPTHRPDVRVLFGEALPRQGVEVDLLAVADADALEAPRWEAGRALLRPARGRLGTMRADVLQQLSLFARCARGYDALVVHDKPILGAIGWLAARLARIPFCYWMSYPLPEHQLWLAARPDVGRARRLYLRARGRLGLAVLRRLLVPRSDWLFVQSDAMERALRDEGVLAHDRASAVPMGVDADAVPEPASPEALPEALRGRRLAVYLGTLDRARRPEVMVDAARRVAERHPDFALLVIGEADEPGDRGWLRSHAERTGAAGCVHFTGRVPYAQGLALARLARVGLSPVPRTPLTEVGSPTKAVEYLACGLSVVCNDQPDQAQVVRASGGGLVAPLDAEGFADAIERLLADPEAARARGEAGRQWVRAHRGYRALAARVAERLRAVVHAAPAGAARARTGS